VVHFETEHGESVGKANVHEEKVHDLKANGAVASEEDLQVEKERDWEVREWVEVQQ